MGRGKLNMKFIMKEKVRVSTYEKRKKGLLKKAKEFSILCGVETCVIIYGPKSDESVAKLEIWPPVHAEVMNVINKYKGKPLHIREKKCYNVLDFFAIRQKKLDDEICKLQKANREAKFSTWDDRINTFSVNQLSALLARLDSNLETVKNRIKMIKGNQQSLLQDSKPMVFGGAETQFIQPTLDLYNNQVRSSLFQKNLDMEITKHHQLQQQQQQQQQPMFIVPSYNPFSSGTDALQWQPFNLNPMENPMTMVPTNGGLDFTHVDGECSSSISHMSSSAQAFNYDPAAAQMVDNVALNNHSWRVPICFYGQFMQPMTQFMQSPMSSFPSQFGEPFRNVGDRNGSMNKKQKF